MLFDAISRLDDHERNLARELLEGILLKHDARRWVATG